LLSIILLFAQFIISDKCEHIHSNRNYIYLGKTVQWGKQEPLSYQYQGQKYIAAIDRAYSEAARKLLEVLMKENDLMGRLRSVKSYFLLAQGDFVVSLVFTCYQLVFLKFVFKEFHKFMFYY